MKNFIKISYHFSDRGLRMIQDLYTSTQQNAVKNRNMLIVCGIFSLKHYIEHHQESVKVYFTGGKCINIYTSYSININGQSLSLFLFLVVIQDTCWMGNKIVTHHDNMAGKHPMFIHKCVHV